MLLVCITTNWPTINQPTISQLTINQLTGDQSGRSGRNGEARVIYVSLTIFADRAQIVCVCVCNCFCVFVIKIAKRASEREKNANWIRIHDKSQLLAWACGESTTTTMCSFWPVFVCVWLMIKMSPHTHTHTRSYSLACGCWCNQDTLLTANNDNKKPLAFAYLLFDCFTDIILLLFVACVSS